MRRQRWRRRSHVTAVDARRRRLVRLPRRGAAALGLGCLLRDQGRAGGETSSQDNTTPPFLSLKRPASAAAEREKGRRPPPTLFRVAPQGGGCRHAWTYFLGRRLARVLRRQRRSLNLCNLLKVRLKLALLARAVCGWGARARGSVSQRQCGYRVKARQGNHGSDAW